jgi:ketosteroid isomerase-like protein
MDAPDRGREIEQAIADSKAVFVAGLKSGDPALASTAYAEDARMLMPSTEPVVGREAIAAYWSAGVEAGISDVELHSLELKGNGGLAYEIGRYSLSLCTDEGPVVDRGNYVLVHRRQEDGSWLRAVEMFNPDTPPAAVGERTEGGRDG